MFLSDLESRELLVVLGDVIDNKTELLSETSIGDTDVTMAETAILALAEKLFDKASKCVVAEIAADAETDGEREQREADERQGRTEPFIPIAGQDTSLMLRLLLLPLIDDYLNRLEYEMEGEAIWEDRAYALTVQQAIIDTKAVKKGLLQER
jgi:hypothetical protein